MVLYSRGLRGRPAGQAVVAEVEDAIDVYFKSCSSPGDDVTRSSTPKDYSWLQASSGRISRSRPVIPPLLELHLIQLGNKLTIGEAEVARSRFRRAVSAAALGPPSGSISPDYVTTSCTDPEGNTVQSRATSLQQHPGAAATANVPTTRSRCCNCPEAGVAATDVVVDQLVRMMRKVILDIMDDNATTTLLRSRVSRQRLSASVRDDRIRSSSSSSLSSSCSSSSSSSSSMSKVAIITPANEANNSCPVAVAAEAPVASVEPPSATSTPTCSSPSSLFSSPSSSAGEKRREGGGGIGGGGGGEGGHGSADLLRLPSPSSSSSNNNEEEESSAFGGATAISTNTSSPSCEVAPPPTPSHRCGPSEIKHIEPIFLRCPKRVEENLAASHSFVRSREGSVVPSLRGTVSPRPKKSSHTTAGDELQMRLNAILHTNKRDVGVGCGGGGGCGGVGGVGLGGVGLGGVGGDKSMRNMSPRGSEQRIDECQPPPSATTSSSSPSGPSPSSSYHYQMSSDRCIDSTKPHENGESPLSFYDDPSSHPFSLNCEATVDHPPSPVYHAPPPPPPPSSMGGGGGGQGGGGGVVVGGNQGVGIPSHPSGSHLESHTTWRDPEDELQRTCGPMYAKPPRYSIFTISGTLTDPFGTNAKYSLRSLSTAHF